MECFRGSDDSGQIHVVIGGTHDVSVHLDHGWRRDVPATDLGTAVVRAYQRAGAARLTSWNVDDPDPPPPARFTGDDLLTLRRALRDLVEFRLQLTETAAAPVTMCSPGRGTRATAVGGQLVAVELDPAMQATATDEQLEHDIGHATSAALASCRSAPLQALEGCPDLRTVLERAGAVPSGRQQREHR